MKCRHKNTISIVFIIIASANFCYSGSIGLSNELSNKNQEEISPNSNWRNEDINESHIFSEDIVCPSSTLVGMIDNVKTFLKEPDKLVSGKEYGCTVLTLLKENQKNAAYIYTLQSDRQDIDLMKKDIKTLTDTVALLSSTHEKIFTREFPDSKPQEKPERSLSEKTDSYATHAEVLWLIDADRKFIDEVNNTAHEKYCNLDTKIDTFDRKAQRLDEMISKLSTTVQYLKQQTSKTTEKVEKVSEHMFAKKDRLFNKTQGNTQNGTTHFENSSNRRLTKLARDISSSNPSSSLPATVSENARYQHRIFSEPHELIMELKEQINFLEEEFSSQLKSESSRAKESEDKLFTIINNEIQRAKKQESDTGRIIDVNIYRLTSEIMTEFNRAKTVEEKLDKRISDEFARASNAEANLLYNLNEELKRASGKEKENQNLISDFEEKFQGLGRDLRSELQKEVQKLKPTVDEMNSKLEKQSPKIQQIEMELKSILNDEMTKVQKTVGEVKDLMNQESKKSHDIESHILSTVLAEVTRDVKELKQDLNEEIDRAKRVEHSLKQNSVVGQVEEKIENLQKKVKSEIFKLETSSGELSEKSSKLLRALGELNRKVQASRRSLEIRIAEVEEEVKKIDQKDDFKDKFYKPGKKPWFRSSSPGIFDRLMNLFGRRAVLRSEMYESPKLVMRYQEKKSSSKQMKDERNVEDLDGEEDASSIGSNDDSNMPDIVDELLSQLLESESVASTAFLLSNSTQKQIQRFDKAD